MRVGVGEDEDEDGEATDKSIKTPAQRTATVTDFISIFSDTMVRMYLY